MLLEVPLYNKFTIPDSSYEKIYFYSSSYAFWPSG